MDSVRINNEEHVHGGSGPLVAWRLRSDPLTARRPRSAWHIVLPLLLVADPVVQQLDLAAALFLVADLVAQGRPDGLDAGLGWACIGIIVFF